MATVIVGGGLMGLTLAYRLSQAGKKVVLLEAAEQLGGLSTWKCYGEFIWDKYYHVILKTDSHLLSLIEELGLKGELSWRATKTGFLFQGELISMSNYVEFLRFPALNLLQKGRLALGLLYSHYLQHPKSLESMNAEEWLSKIFGRTIFKRIWEPLLESKFGVLKKEVPATIIWSVIDRYFSTRGKSSGREWMGHLRPEGLKILFETLARKIGEKGGEIYCGTKVLSIGERLVESNRGSFAYERVLSTLPTSLLQKIAPEVKGELPKASMPKFLGVIRLALVLEKPLSPYYVTNLIDRGFPFTGVIDLSAVADPDEMAGKSLAMIPRYDLPSSSWFEKSDEEVLAEFLAALETVWPGLEARIERSFVDRERIVQALFSGPPPDESEPLVLKGGKIWSINAELAGRDTLNNNAIVRVANAAGRRVLK